MQGKIAADAAVRKPHSLGLAQFVRIESVAGNALIARRLVLASSPSGPIDGIERHCTKKKRKTQAQACRHDDRKVLFIREQFETQQIDLLAVIAKRRRMRVHPGDDVLRKELLQ